jgi:hypothetical protein
MNRHLSWQRLVAVVRVALLLAVVDSGSHAVLADLEGFVFTPLVYLGNPTPDGQRFLDSFDSSRINNRGDVQFGSIVTTEGEGREFLLIKGEITEIPIRAGKPAPDDKLFGPGSLSPSTLNDRGEVGLVYVIDPFVFPQDGGPSFGVNAGVYRFSPSTQKIVSVMTPGVTPAPGGGLFVGAGFGANLNNRGDLVFAGIVPTDKGFPLPDDENGLGVVTGLFLHSEGETILVARPDDPMPGGGELVTASNIDGWQIHVNNARNVVFNATRNTTSLSTDEGAPIPDTGLYVWSHGSLRLVAWTGTVIPGVGTIAGLRLDVLTVPPPDTFVPNSGAHNNDRGQVVFGDTLTDGRGVLLRATPKPHKRHH